MLNIREGKRKLVSTVKSSTDRLGRIRRIGLRKDELSRDWELARDREPLERIDPLE